MKRAVIALALVLISTASFAQNGPRPGPPQPPQQGAPAPNAPNGPGNGPGGELLSPPQLAHFLDLSEAQKISIEALRKTLEATAKPLLEQQRANHVALEAAVKAGDAAKAGQLLVANYAIGQQLKAAGDAFKSGFEALLTSQQKAKLEIYREIAEIRNTPPPPPQQ